MICGEKVDLIPISSEDTENIVKWRNNPKVRENFIFREVFTHEMHEKWLQDKVSTGEVVQFIIVEKTSSAPVGSVYFRDIDLDNHSAEFGIFIGEDSARGKGFGTEATALSFEYAKSAGLNHLLLRVIDGNLPAINAYKKNGFVEIHLEHNVKTSDGIEVDVIFMEKEL